MNKTRDLPEGWKEKRLDQILTEEQIIQVRKCINDMLKRRISAESPEFIKGLKQILNEMEEELKEREIVPDFLAYSIQYALMQGANV